MWKLWGSVVAIALVASGCATVGTRPVEIEAPASARHFIVDNSRPESERQKPRPQHAASAVVVSCCEVSDPS
jgi:hypothetical protein